MVFSDLSSSTVPVDEKGEWSLILDNLPQGSTTISFFAKDLSENISEPVFVTVQIDSVPLELSMSVYECDLSLIEEECLITPTSTVRVLWSNNKDKNLTYELYSLYDSLIGYDDYRQGYPEEPTLLVSTSSQEFVYQIPRRSQAVGLWLLAKEGETVIASTTSRIWIGDSPFVINEIGWAGTKASSSDKWIELSSFFPFDVDLSSFYLKSPDGGVDIQLTGTLKGDMGYDYHNYYLVSVSENALSEVKVDLVNPFSISNQNIQLKLIKKKGDQEKVLEETPLWNLSELETNSLERRWVNYPVGEMRNWMFANPPRAQNGKDRDGNLIDGTPGASNSASIPVPI